MSSVATSSPPRLLARELSKSFGGTRALSQVSLALQPGTVHAVLGENGAGKSTLMKILAGVVAPDSGTLALDGAAYAPRGPLEARRRGVAIVHQELSLCPHLSAQDNIVLGSEPARWGWLSPQKARARAERALGLLSESGRTLPLAARVSELSPAQRQLVEIARALDQEDCKLLIVDEPTSSLGQDDVERLFLALRRLCERGLGILYVSHFLEEVRRIAHSFSVLRDGKTVLSGALADHDNEALVASMAGQSVQRAARRARTPGAPLLSLSELAGQRLPLSASLELCRGEVLGIAGLMGSGRSELLRAVFGLDRVKSGSVRVAALAGPGSQEAATSTETSPRARLASGVGLASEDRAHEGLALELSVAQNLTLSKLGPLGISGWISPARERQQAQRWVQTLGIKCRGPEQRCGELSGGNQQKVALGRLLYHDVDVLLLDEPTRGIDVRSRGEIHAVIDELCTRGKAVLLVSSQFEELLAVCDRIAVMHRGVLGAPRPASELDEHALVKEAAGA